MWKTSLKDIVVIVPGIMGSLLTKGGKPLWTVSGNALGTAFGIRAMSIQALRLEGDDHTLDDLGDDVKATGLIPNSYLVAGLVRLVDGYGPLTSALNDSFSVERGDVAQFPYDWRRDNRVSARKLKRFVDGLLAQRRQVQPDARVILLAHSMGGLVSSYYLEVLEGWRDARALITFGTPFRGSVQALGYLANGYKLAGKELVDAVRSFTSAYQLLPIYEAVCTASGYARVAEVASIPNVSRPRALEALAFHRAIEGAWKANRNNLAYLNAGYELLPIVGTRQKTFQSADLRNGQVVLSYALPPVVEQVLDGGDGTVPRASAIPLARSHGSGGTFYAQRHDSLQADPVILHDAMQRILQMQAGALDRVRGPSEALPKLAASISLALDDVFAADEPATIHAQFIDAKPEIEQTGLELLVDRIDTAGAAQSSGDTAQTYVPMDPGTHVMTGLAPGLYKLVVRARFGGYGAPEPVCTLFGVES